jgi:tol-pal system protein YbgF
MRDVYRLELKPRCGLPGAAAVLLAVGAMALSGCTAQDEIDALRREQRQMARRLADTRADVDSLRLAVSKLQSRYEEQGGQSTRAPSPSELDDRLRALEQSAGQARESAPEPPPSAPPATSGATGTAPLVQPQTGGAEPPAGRPEAQASGDELPHSIDIGKDASRGGPDAYREGLALYQKGDYARATQTLRSFVNKDPKNELVPSAQLWIGESYYAQRKYNEAILAYNEILVSWPKSDRVPAALLRQAQAFTELGDKIDARLILQKLVADHPNTEEAAIAKRKLLALGA